MTYVCLKCLSSVFLWPVEIAGCQVTNGTGVNRPKYSFSFFLSGKEMVGRKKWVCFSLYSLFPGSRPRSFPSFLATSSLSNLFLLI